MSTRSIRSVHISCSITTSKFCSATYFGCRLKSCWHSAVTAQFISVEITARFTSHSQVPFAVAAQYYQHFRRILKVPQKCPEARRRAPCAFLKLVTPHVLCEHTYHPILGIGLLDPLGLHKLRHRHTVDKAYLIPLAVYVL